MALVYRDQEPQYQIQEDEKQQSKTKQPEQLFTVYPRRWLVMLSFCFFTFCSAIGFVKFSPILDLAAKFYGVTDNAIIWFSNCYYITYALLSPFSIKPLDIRLDYSLNIASFLTALGYWMNYFAYQTYSIALIGFILIGLGQIFILAAPAYIADKWFPMHERTLSTCLGSFFNLLGLNFSILYSSITFQNIEDDPQQVEKEINKMSLLCAILSTIAFICCITMIKKEPPTPPSFSAIDIIRSFKRVFKNSKAIMDLVTLSIFIGTAWAYMVAITILLKPYNYSQKQIGIVSIVYCATGTIGGISASIYVDYQILKHHKPHYDLIIKLFKTIAIIGMLTTALIIQYVNETVVIILAGVVGLGLNSFQPLAIQCFIEQHYPSFELVLITAMMQMANLLGFMLNYILAFAAFENIGLWVILVMLAPFYFYLLIAYRTKFKRFDIECQQQQGIK